METVGIGETAGTPRKSMRIARRRQSLAGNKVFVDGQEARFTSSLVDSDSENTKVAKGVEPELPGTPRRNKRVTEQELLQTPRSSTAETVHTPRRSARKSIKPAQDYEDIVNSKAVRSLKKDTAKEVLIEEEEQEVHKDVHKWTPSKVGRVSEKRKSRKGRRNLGAKKCLDDGERIHVDSEVLEVIANDEDENKENVEPEELMRNRKSPKGNEPKGCISRRRSMEVLQESKVQSHVSPNTRHASLGKEEENKGMDEMKEASDLQDLKSKRQSESSKLEELGLAPIEKVTAENIEQYAEEGEIQIQPNNNTFNLNTTDIIETIVISPVEYSKSLTEPPQTEPSVVKTGGLENTSQPSDDLDETDVEIINDDIVNTKEASERPSSAEVSDSEFNSSDCIIISPLFENNERLTADEEENNAGDQNEEPSSPQSSNIIHGLQTSPVMPPCAEEKEEAQKENEIERETPEKTLQLPTVMINDKEQLRTETPKCVKKISIVTPLRKFSSKDVPKPYRRPTPYKAKTAESESLQCDRKIVEGGEEDNNIPQHSPHRLNVTTMEPKELILRSIRKRSLSACTERPQKKHLHRVKFHSPANQTTAIEDLDILIAKSAQKSRELRRKQDASTIDISNVTKRRKRSFSVDETISMHRKVPVTPVKERATTPQKLQPRTRIPNFAAIHQRQFNKMENLVDHVSRKAERAKQLISSSSKLRPTQKSYSSNNLSLETTFSGSSHIMTKKPTALKQLDLSECTTKTTSVGNVKTLLRPFVGGDDGDNDDENVANSATCNLPDPRLFKNLAIVQPLATAKVSKAAPIGKKLQKVSKPTHEPPKPPFNLSTKIKTGNPNCSILDTAEAAATSALKLSSGKLVLRRQRHMDMFKGRAGGGRISANREKEKTSEIIRGVRSNRRFDLQMQHRKNLTQDP